MGPASSPSDYCPDTLDSPCRNQQGRGGSLAHRHVSKNSARTLSELFWGLTSPNRTAAAAGPLSQLCWRPALPTSTSAPVAVKSQQEDTHSPHVGRPGGPGSSLVLYKGTTFKTRTVTGLPNTQKQTQSIKVNRQRNVPCSKLKDKTSKGNKTKPR